MTPEQAAWVREYVWRPIWLRNHNHIPSTTFACACQGPPSCACQRSNHGDCRPDRGVHHETVIQTLGDRPARFAEPYAHRSQVVSGVNVLAWVWPAGIPCREICTCFCHRPGAVVPVDAAASVQLDLFAGASA